MKMAERPYEIPLDQCQIDWIKNHPMGPDDDRVMELFEEGQADVIAEIWLKNMADLYSGDEFNGPKVREAIAVILAEITPP